MLGEVLYLRVLRKGITSPRGFSGRTVLYRQTETQVLDERPTLGYAFRLQAKEMAVPMFYLTTARPFIRHTTILGFDIRYSALGVLQT